MPKNMPKNKDDVLSDKRKNGKERPWKPKKVCSLMLADCFQRLGQNKRAMRVRFCSSQLAFAVNTETGEKRLHSADFCRERLCPMCAWRKSLKCFQEVSRVMDAAQQEQANLVPIFLTLTLKNCTGEDLDGTLDTVFQGWHRLINNKRMKRIFKGWFRALEVTYNKEADTFHPHIHAILMVDKGYFKGKDYMTTAEWVKAWRKACRLSYDPVCDIRKVKGGNKAIKEVSKYTVKDSDFISEDKDLTDKLVAILSKALRYRRLYAFGGVLKDIAKRLGADRPDEGDLIHVDEDGELRTDVGQMIVVYRWNMGLSNYIKRGESLLSARADSTPSGQIAPSVIS